MLIDAVARHMAERPFTWGENDCCLSVCNILRDLGHGDPGAAYRGLYRDEEGARAFGPVDAIAEAICTRRGWLEIPPVDARPGDVGVRENVLGIRLATRWAWKGERGLVLGGKARRAWRVA